MSKICHYFRRGFLYCNTIKKAGPPDRNKKSPLRGYFLRGSADGLSTKASLQQTASSILQQVFKVFKWRHLRFKRPRIVLHVWAGISSPRSIKPHTGPLECKRRAFLPASVFYPDNSDSIKKTGFFTFRTFYPPISSGEAAPFFLRA